MDTLWTTGSLLQGHPVPDGNSAHPTVTSLDSESLLLRTFDVQLLQLWRLAPRRQEPEANPQLPDHIESSTLM
jgi:hypothetical protein